MKNKFFRKDMKLLLNAFLSALLLITPHFVFSQKTVIVDSTDPNFRTVISGEEYARGGLYQLLWGKHYRKEWTTPVKVPVVNLDTVYGGLTATEQGGGRQTKTLRLKDKNGKQYVLRSIDKDYGKALPDIALGTFIEDLAKDQVSTAHPFASVTVPVMIDAAGVYHTNPKIVFVPYTASLGQYNETFANMLCLLEERPADDQSDAANFGFSEDVKGTEKMFQKFYSENDHRVDQKAFVKARLFDMFLGDWGRHDDQWRWAEFDSADYKIYRPIPRDRDQAYTKFDGVLIRRILGNEDLEHLRSFSYKIKNIKKYNFPARYIDRQLTNEVPRQTWIDIASGLQQSLTDAVIEESVKQLPPELFNISGNEIIDKLKSRREHLVEYADHYYRFLTKIVEVVGTSQSELFQVDKLNNNETKIALYDLNKEGKPKAHPFYSRIFNSDETKEIRLYGLSGNDVFHIEGSGNDGIKIRIIGGTEKDSLINESTANKLKYYDNKDNIIVGRIRSHLSNDTAINVYDYKAYKYNSGYTIKAPNYSNTRGIFLQVGYTYTRQQWRKEPFGWTQKLRFIYSISNKSFGGEYEAVFMHVIGKWNLALNASYDQKLKNYFFGAGNNSVYAKDISYYRLFTSEGRGTVGLNRLIGKHNLVTISGNYQSIDIKKEEGQHLVSDVLPVSDPSLFERKDFAGAQLNYAYYNVNDPVVPTKGIGFLAGAAYTQNLSSNKSFNRYTAGLGFYLPLSKAFSIAVRSGAATVTGNPEFYQLNWLGGGQNLRGFHRQRFYGKTSFFDNNELRWLPTVKGYLFKGKMGLIAFLDEGRVWQPGETSDTWHMGYGGGFLIAPFNKISLTVYYGMSKEDQLLHIRLGKFF
jgi:hypothetical protein